MTYVTQNDLLMYLYMETSPDKKKYIESVINTDAEVEKTLNNLIWVKDKLEEIKMLSPDSRTINNIIKYAQKTSGEAFFHK